nr:proline-rich protein 36-like [Misgurnus anguillicaudatus]
MDPADTESGCSATAQLSTTAQEEDSAFTAHRNHHARLLFGMRQRGAEIRSFASKFLEEARLAGLSGNELKVIFYACLDEPLRSSEVELLKPLDFFDMVNFVRNRPEPKSRPLSPVPEGRVVGRMVLESSAPTTSSSISSAPPASLRGSRLAIRGRGIQTGAIRLGRSTLISLAPETTPAPDLYPALPVSGRRKKRKKNSSALQLAATPQSSEKQQPLSAPLQPLPSAQPPLQPLPSAQPPLQPLPSAQPPLQPLPSAQPPLQPLPSAQPPLQPLPSAQPPLQPLPSAQPTAAAFVSVPSPLPSAAAPVTVPVLSPQPSAVPPVTVPASSPLPSAAAPVTIPVSPPQPSAAPPVTVSMSSSLPDAAPPVIVPALSPLPSAASSVKVPVSSLQPPAAPPVMFPVSPQPLNPDLVVPALPQAVSSPRNPVRPARPPRTQPSATPRGQRSRPVPSPIPPPVNVVVPPPPLPCLLFLLSHPNPLVVLSCLPLLVFVMFSWVLSSVQSVLSCVSP